MKEFVLTGFVKSGELKLRNRQRLVEELRHWSNCEVVVTIEKKHAIRSVEANKYYFGVCLKILSEHTGYTVDELHEWAKATFIPKHVAMLDRNGDIVDGKVIGGTTTTLNRVQFYEYVEQIRQFASEKLDLNIPDPDPRWREKEHAA